MGELILGFLQKIAAPDDVRDIVAEGSAYFSDNGRQAARGVFLLLAHMMYFLSNARQQSVSALRFGLPRILRGMRVGARQAHWRPRS